jgi:DNA-binding transcriptional ArsR family regulator
MPILEDPTVAPPATIVVEPSLALELFGAVLVLRSGRKGPAHPLFDPDNPRSLELTRRAREVWPDEADCFPELLVLAQAAGLLFEQDGDRLVAHLSEAAQLDIGEPALASETEEERLEILSRLDRLRRKPGLRRRWVELFTAIWEEIRDFWNTEGLQQVRDASRQVRRRLSEGESVWDLDPRLLGWREEPTREVSKRVEAVVPSYFLGGWKVLIDLPGLVLVGFRVEDSESVARLRQRSMPVAERLKALSDGTRLAILAHLSGQPARITDVARSFGISQPTASVHFRVLRDAGLVATERRDGQTLYSVDRRRVDALLEEGRQLVAPA